jgi:serine/threonine protein kinase
LDHPNIMRIYEVFQDQDNNLSIVMEHCAGGDLYTREPYTEGQAIVILRQILEAVNYLHTNQHMIHRDLKCTYLQCAMIMQIDS